MILIRLRFFFFFDNSIVRGGGRGIVEFLRILNQFLEKIWNKVGVLIGNCLGFGCCETLETLGVLGFCFGFCLDDEKLGF